MVQQKIRFPLLLAAVFTVAAAAHGSQDSDTSEISEAMEESSNPLDVLRDLHPNPQLTPEEVVEIQLKALRGNNSIDEGIALAFRFASSTNRRPTGLSDKLLNVEQDDYAPIIHSERFLMGPIEQQGGIAMVAVWLESPQGVPSGYIFVLSLQDNGRFEGCWMTDGVLDVDMEEMRNLPQEELQDA